MSKTAARLNEREMEFEEYAWTIAEAGASLAAALTGLEAIASLSKIGGYLEVRKAMSQRIGGLEPNPQFVFHGVEGESTKCTQYYLYGRTAKSLLGTGLGLASKAATSATVVDVGGLLKEGQAIGLSTAHALQLSAIASRYPRSQTIASWVDLLAKLKLLKAATRSAGLVGAAIPYAAVGVVMDCIQAAAKIGIKLKFGTVAGRAAMELHWRAYCEQVLTGSLGGRSAGAAGPATAILYELFKKRGATRIFGKYDVDKMIREPGGWLAVNDKITLI